jgi:hypothetical protein
MGIELDHLFVCTARGAPEAEGLVQLGFHEGPPNQHSGQGTACRRFSFANAMIELLWVSDERELEAKVLSAPCLGRDGLVGKTTPVLSEFACGLLILQTQGRLFRHGSIGRPICQIRC